MELTDLSAWNSADDCVKRLFLDQANFPAVTKQVREHCLEMMIGALPDDLKGLFFPGRGANQHSYTYISFLKDAGNGNYLLPGALSGSDLSWWRSYGIGLLAQTALSCTSSAKGRLDPVKVKNFIAGRETELDAFMYLYYCYFYIRMMDNDTHYAWLEAQVLGINRAIAQYRDILVAVAPIRAIWASSGMWPNMRQELYHHWLKLTAIYASPSQIDGIIDTVKQAGMPVPSDLDKGNWHKFVDIRDARSWISAEDLVPLCKKTMTESRILPKQGWWDVRLDPIWIDEYYTEDFIEKHCGSFRP